MYAPELWGGYRFEPTINKVHSRHKALALNVCTQEPFMIGSDRFWIQLAVNGKMKLQLDSAAPLKKKGYFTEN